MHAEQSAKWRKQWHSLAAIVIAVTLAGCTPTSGNRISDSTAPSEILTSKDSSVTREFKVHVRSDAVRSTNIDDLRHAAIVEARKKHCADFTQYHEETGRGVYRGSVPDFSVQWFTLHIRCNDIGGRESKAKGVDTLNAFIEKWPSIKIPSESFDTHSETYQVPKDRLFDAVVRVLKEEGNPVFEAKKDYGTILTARVRHGAIGFPRYEQYVVAVEREGPQSSSITFKLLIHIPDLKFDENNLAQSLQRTPAMLIAPRKYVYEKAAEFVERLKSILVRSP